MGMLPDVTGLRGLDVGCGEGHNTRLVAQRGAQLTAIDIARRFVDYAQERERQEPLSITYLRASAVEMPFAEASFDFVMATMSMMDVPDQGRAIREVSRVLRPGGFFQFSILHPCFMTPRFKWVLDEAGHRVAMECGDYFSQEQGTIEEWIFGAAPDELKERFAKFRIPRFFHTLSTWLNMLCASGLSLLRKPPSPLPVMTPSPSTPASPPPASSPVPSTSAAASRRIELHWLTAHFVVQY